MDHDFSAALPELLSLAVVWAERESQNILTHGKPLAFWQIAEARQVGVRKPEKVRILQVDAIPRPADSRLLAATQAIGLLEPETLGLTLGHGVMILRPKTGERRLLRHELRHVARYEAAGSIAAFLAGYLFGYQDVPIETDARCHERVCPRPAMPL